MTIQDVTLILVLIAAFGSAVWNILVKKSENSWAFVTMMVVPQFLVALPLLFISPTPSTTTLGYILTSALVQTGYILFLTNSYQHGLISRIYPLIIGSTPLLSLLFHAYFQDYPLIAEKYIGVLILSTGIMGFAFVGRRNDEIFHWKALFYILGTSLFIFAYSTIDSIGIETVSDPLSYISWLFVIKAILLFIPMVFLFGKEMKDLAYRNYHYIFSGLLAGFGYAVAIFAFQYSATSVILALRSTSIVFVFLLSIFILDEKASFKALAFTLITTLGVFLILI